MGPAFMRKYAVGAGADIYLPMIKAGSSDFAVGGDWTPVAGDVKVSIDGAGQGNITTLPVYSEGSWKFVFSNAELTGKKISIRVVDSATKAVEDQAFEIETFGHASALYPVDFSAAMLPVDAIAISGDATAADNFETMLDGTGGKTLSLGQLQIILAGPGFNLGCIYIENQGDGNGIYVKGGGSGSGMSVNAGDTGIGLNIAGGATSGVGMRVRSLANNDDAVVFSADGSGVDFNAGLEALMLAAVDFGLRSVPGTELSAIPDKDAPIADQIQLLFQALRNGYLQTPTSYVIYDDAGVAIGSAIVSVVPNTSVARGKLT